MYSNIIDFGNVNESNNDPATYCVLDGLDSQFLHGSIGFQKGNFLCSEYMSNRCSSSWDSLCDAFSERRSKNYPRPQCAPSGLTDGEAFLRETAFKRYLLSMKNCYTMCEPFDPTVANSPQVCYLSNTAGSTGPTPYSKWAIDGHTVKNSCNVSDTPSCEKIYGFTEEQMKTLDIDPIMNKILANPNVAIDLFAALARWVSATSNWDKISGTKFSSFVRHYFAQ